MSKIDKLSILGVRSFSNTSSEVIQFYSPLTIIAGLNGSGKTTIVECLKYATSGELPPNSRGGAFIHDPQLANEKEVLAQVRFSFLSTTQARMVATRNLQLTVKKTTRSQKTLEGSLLMVKDGERTAISSRVAELDQILPQYLGVSAAILDNVIFCHQDESLWPLSEPSVLKKKFDEIFEAMKYTKAIDNIKVLRKKQNEELAKFRLSEQHAKENKDRADKAERRSQELSDEIEALRAEREALHQRSTAVATKAEEAFNSAAQFTEIVETLKSTRQNRDWHEKRRAELLDGLEERSEPDEWLKSELDQSAEREEAQKRSRMEKAKHYEAVMKEINRTRELQSDKRMEAGRLEQQKASHEAKIRDRETAIQRAARDHNIRGYEADLDDMQVTEFIERIAKISKDQAARVDRATRDHATEVQKLQVIIDQLREQRSTLLEGKKTAKEMISSNEQKISSAHNDLGRLNVDELSRTNVEARISELQSNLENTKQRLDASEKSDSIRTANKELQSLDIEISTLNRELIENTKHAGDLARLDYLQKEASDRQRNLDALQATYGGRFQSLLGREWEVSSLEKDFRDVLDAKKQNVTAAERERDTVARQLEQIEYKLKLARADLKEKREDLQESARVVQMKSEVDPEDYPETLAAAEHDRDVLRADVDNYENMNKYFQEAIEIVTKHKMCRLCRRGFDDERAAKQFVETLTKAVSQKQQEKVQQELAKIEAYLPQCREAGTSYDTWVRLSKKEIPALERDISKHEEERETAVQELERHDRIVSDQEDVRRETETLSKPVSTISKCKTDYDEFEGQMAALRSKQESARQVRGLDDLQQQIELLNGQAKDQRQKLNKLQQEEQGLRDKLSALEIDLAAERARLVKADHELEKRNTIAMQIAELKNVNQKQQGIIASIEQQLSGLNSRMSEETMRLDDIRARNKQKEAELQRTLTTLTDTLRDLERVQKEVRHYEESGGPSQLARCQREIEAFDDAIRNHELEAKQLTISINEIQEELNKKDRIQRIIRDNLSYRQVNRELAGLDEEIARLAGQNAEADREHHRRNAERLQKEHQELLAQEASKVERMKVKDDQLLQLLEDWNTDYKDAATTYKKAHIQVETTKAAVEDLGRYGGALDKAIMKYHSIKMEEINRIIDELWRRTYQGTDVDTILIRSDNESARGNRSYNYRVCMIKQDAEMDMRGRCSAGQKVLASIIIRLALAECFGVNCGIIALDEPTTNLDRDNIRSLAESLHHIIRQRRQQRNFQLIIITHDEDFLKEIRPADFCDYYYRISRNDRQKSIIERQSIGEVV